MEVAGFIASFFIGVSLGLVGGGGAILTVPVLVYLFGLAPLHATSYSLFIVGVTSFVGAISKWRHGQVHLKAALLFGAASTITVLLTRTLLVPALPHTLVTIGGFTLTTALATMLLFALLMLLAAVGMIRNGTTAPNEAECAECVRFARLLGYGIAVGLVTGLLGAGGGFLIIPALVFLLKLPMKKAIGTSLLIIALNALVGFAGDLHHLSVNWPFLLMITVIATAGIFVGGAIGKGLDGARLKRGFGWFVLVMGLFILLKELAGL